MNRYGRMAQSHWSRFLPRRYAQIEHPTEFFTRLGLEVEDAVTALTTQIAGSDRPQESYLAKVGRLRMSKLQAEESVLAEQVLLPAEPGSPMDEELVPPPLETEEDWIPVREDQSHRFWRETTAE